MTLHDPDEPFGNAARAYRLARRAMEVAGLSLLISVAALAARWL